MTDVANEAVTVAAQRMSAADIVFSLDFVTKLAKKLVKDFPTHSPEQIADAIGAVFSEKLAKAEKRLQNVETIRAQYNLLRSAQPMVEHVVDAITSMNGTAIVDYAAQIQQKPVKAKSASKANGKADPAQQQMAI